MDLGAGITNWSVLRACASFRPTHPTRTFVDGLNLRSPSLNPVERALEATAGDDRQLRACVGLQLSGP